MTQRTWLIIGVSSGFGREMTEQLLQRGDRVVGTVRKRKAVAGLAEQYPEKFRAELLDVTDAAATKAMVDRAFGAMGRIDVVISNAGYGLFGAAEELSDAQVEQMIATNLMGSIQLIRAALPHLRQQGGGRIIQISTYGGQVAYPGNSMYHATKWGIEGFVESVAQEVALFHATPAHAFMKMLDPKNGLAPGDPMRMAARIIESVDKEPAPLRMVLGSQALESTLSTLKQRVADFETQRELAKSTDFLPGE